MSPHGPTSHELFPPNLVTHRRPALRAVAVLTSTSPRALLESMIAAHYALHAVGSFVGRDAAGRDDRLYCSALDRVTPRIRTLFREHGTRVCLPNAAFDPSTSSEFWSAIVCALLEFARASIITAERGNRVAQFAVQCFEAGCIVADSEANPDKYPALPVDDCESSDEDEDE